MSEDRPLYTTEQQISPEVWGNVLAERARAITYDPRMNQVTGSVNATLFLQQVHYWWTKTRRPFYKFSAPCNHEKYKPGDSWQEELGMTRREFEAARKAVAKRIYQGDSKADALKEFPIVYWRDSDNLTWYEVNEALYVSMVATSHNANVQNVQSIRNVQTVHSIRNVQNVQSIESEITTESTTDSPLPPSAATDGGEGCEGESPDAVEDRPVKGEGSVQSSDIERKETGKGERKRVSPVPVREELVYETDEAYQDPRMRQRKALSPETPLEKLIIHAVRRKGTRYITPPMREQLRKSRPAGLVGELPTIQLSAEELYQTDELFRAFVKDRCRVAEQYDWSRSDLVDAITDYGRLKTGWLAYEARERVSTQRETYTELPGIEYRWEDHRR